MLVASRAGSGYGNLAGLLTEYRSWLAGLIEEGKRRGELRGDIDSFETAAAFAAWFDGAVFHWIVLPETVSLEQMSERFIDMAIRGLRNDEAKNRGDEA